MTAAGHFGHNVGVETEESVRVWSVDLAAGRASYGAVLISFRHCYETGMTIDFIEHDDCSLERQCLLAGEATAAVRKKIRMR